MTVQQLIDCLSSLPADAPVLIEGDGGLSPLGEVELLPALAGQPREVLLRPDMTPD